MNSGPLISVIIPNWNGKHFLVECIDSLKDQTFRDFETILVDNGSTDGSAEFAEERYGGFIRVIRNKKNLGFTGGNNVGIEAARGEYIVLLNNDTWAEPTWLQELAKATSFNRPIGMWASKVCSYYKRDQIEGVGELIYWDGLCRSKG
ncbi:MAG: glycosyltransferase family 2 protein, partial [Thermodesulfobacteriota bacterium]